MKAIAHRLTAQIVIAMVLAFLIGFLCRYLPGQTTWQPVVFQDLIGTLGQLFVRLIKMLVVPIVLVSLVCGSASVSGQRIGRMGLKTVVLYLMTTAVAVSLALLMAQWIAPGKGLALTGLQQVVLTSTPSFKQVLLDIVPSNPFKALSDGMMLQLIFFALLLGMALSSLGERVDLLRRCFDQANAVMMQLMMGVMRIAPYGVFCLLAPMFLTMGYSVLLELSGYFLVVVAVLLVHVAAVYGGIIRVFLSTSPVVFFKKMRQAAAFALSVSSSTASIPVVLRTVTHRLGVPPSYGALIIPLGATINMDGTAIMQGVATVFLANAYQVHLGWMGCITVVGMATLASVGTAGVPGVGMMTLAVVLKQVGIPVEGIGLIIGVDRLLDMMRTAVNVTGDAMVACLVAQSDQALDRACLQTRDIDKDQQEGV